MFNPSWPEWYRNWLRFWERKQEEMHNFKIATQPGVIVVPANHINGQSLVEWVNWTNETVRPEENGEVVVNQLFAPNGRTIAYLLDLRHVPERFEQRLFGLIQQAHKAGDTPPDLSWLDKKEFTGT